MKLSIPGFSKRNNNTENDARKGSVRHIKPASLVTTRLVLIIVSVLVSLLLAGVIFLLMSGQVKQALLQEAGVTTELAAARVADMVEYYGESAALLAKDPAIADMLMTGDDIGDLLTTIDESVLRAKEESLQYIFPGLINLRLFPPGLEQVDLEASPPLSYAALDQMRAAENSNDTPPAEVHLFRSPQQHVSMVRVVKDPAGSGVVGHIMLSLSNETLQGVFQDMRQVRGYLELQQAGSKGKPVMVASYGDKDYREGGATQIIPIRDSRWQIAYWPAVDILAYMGTVGTQVLVATVLAVGLLLACILMLFQRLHGSLNQGQLSMISLLKDFIGGQVKPDYPGGLVEMNQSLEIMHRLAGTKIPRHKAASSLRERDEAVKSGKKESPEPLFNGEGLGMGLPDDSLIVEEGDAVMGMGQPPASSTGEAATAAAVAAPVMSEADTTGLDTSIFRAYDIRGVVDRSLTAETVKQIGRAIGSEAIQRGRSAVVVGRDGRLSGPALSRALISGITSTGCDVKDIGCVPTPVLYFATHYLDTQSGVVVTGSHNPPDYNGLKIVIDGETLSGESIQMLRQRIEAENFIFGEGSVETMDVMPDYIERIRGDIKVDRELNVVVDCGNGVAGGVAPQLLEELGCKVTSLYCEVDGNFPNHHPDPSKTENLVDLINEVKSQQADIGLAFDGDGDRIGVVTQDGKVIWPDRVLMLYAVDILQRNPGGQIIYDVKCSRHLDSIIRENGGEPLMWKTGHSFIKAKIKDTGALLAGEMSGHIFFKERWYGFDDAMYAAARLLEILGKDERPVAEIFAELPDSINTPELNISMQEGEPPVFIERLRESADFNGAEISTIDGMRVDFEDGWGLVRASNTTPVLVLRFEAETDAALSRIQEEFRRAMLEVDSNLALPF